MVEKHVWIARQVFCSEHLELMTAIVDVWSSKYVGKHSETWAIDQPLEQVGLPEISMSLGDSCAGMNCLKLTAVSKHFVHFKGIGRLEESKL